MMTTSEKATQKSMTRSRRSVHHTNFLWAFFQEFVRSTTQRFARLKRRRLTFLGDYGEQATSSSFSLVLRES